MQKVTKALAAIMLMTVTLFFTGCEKEKNPTENYEVHINPDYVSIDWDKATLQSSDDSTGYYQIRFSGQTPDIQPGSIVTILDDTVAHYIYVETVTVNGNVMDITSTKATLSDIFYDTEFALSTASEGKSSLKGDVHYPVRAFQLDENGKYHLLFSDDVDKGRTNLAHIPINMDGRELWSLEDYCRIYMQKMRIDLSLDFDMYVNFSGRNTRELWANGRERYRSQALDVRASLHGLTQTEQVICCELYRNYQYKPGYEIWYHNPVQPIYIEFVVGGVPIVLKINSDLYREVEIDAVGQLTACAGFKYTAEGNLGFRWQQTQGMSPIKDFSQSLELVPPTIEGRGKIEAKVWVFPRFRVLLDGALGPSFDIKPYISETVSGGFREDLLGQTNDYCAWSFDCNTGLDACCGLSLQFIGYEIENWSTDDWNIFDFPLYHSPQRITHASGRPTPVQSGQVSFYVFDKNYLLNTEVLTILPQIVKFEARGELSSRYAIAQNGMVSVVWSPTANDVLHAKLYDINGNVISEDTIKIGDGSDDPDGNLDDWVDLGLPSGLLWSTRNIGASSPEDYGDYFAWGETSPKSVYDWDTYRYYNSSTGSFSKYTGSDGLTILQPGDDAATANYGGRTPTKEEWQELTNNTTSQWITINGVNGLCFTGSNGNSLFLPAAGFRWGSSLSYAGSYGYYWSSSLYTDNPGGAWNFDFDSDRQDVNGGNRLDGFTVRAVRQN